MGEWVTVTQDIKGEWDEDIRRETQRRGEDNRGPFGLGLGKQGKIGELAGLKYWDKWRNVHEEVQ